MGRGFELLVTRQNVIFLRTSLLMNQANTRLLLCVGTLCASFSKLELFLPMYCAHLVTEDGNIGAIVTSEVSFRNLLAMYRSLIYYKTDDTELRNEADKLIKKLGECESIRNETLHCNLMVDGSHPHSERLFRHKVTAKLRKGLENKIEEYSFKKIEENIQVIEKTFQSLLDYQGKLRERKIAPFHKIGLKVETPWRKT